MNSNDETLLRGTLENLLASGCRPADLVVAAVFSGPRLEPARRAELRTIAVALLDAAGYCACSQPKVSGRCPLCGRI